MVAEDLLVLVYGVNYLPSVSAFVLLILTPLTIFLNMPFALTLLAAGHQKKYLLSSFIGALVNIAINILLIPAYGMFGAALATVFAEIIVLFMLAFFAGKQVAWILPPRLLNLAASVGLMVVGVAVLHLFVLFEILIGALVYISAMFIFKGFTRNDIVQLKTLLGIKSTS